jgi:hypothetical protein
VTIRWPLRYDWPLAGTWLDPLLPGFKRFVRIERADLSQPYERVLRLQAVVRDRAYEIAIDYADSMELRNESVRKADLYFKMQFANSGYRQSHVVPGGYVGRDIYPFLPRIRALKDSTPPQFEVYGRFSVNEAKAARRNAIEILSRQDRFSYEGGDRLVPYTRSLREVARAKVCIDLPGRGDFCFRLVEYLAIGSCSVGPPHRTILHVPLRDREHLVHTEPDLSDLVTTCEAYLTDDAARERIEHNSRSFFDRYLHRDQLAAYYLHSVVQRFL